MFPKHLRRLTGGLVAVALLSGCTGNPTITDNASARLEAAAQSTAVRPPTDRRVELQKRDTDRDEAPVEIDDDATLEDYLGHAARRNAGLVAAYLRWQAAAERAPQARSLPDPRLTYGYFLAEIETRVGSQEQQVGLSQTFPWFGKLGDREAAATSAARAEYRRFEAARLELFYRVEVAYNELVLLKRSLDIARENLQLLQQFERIARARYRVAATGHPDVIRIQVELGKLEDRIRQLENTHAPLAARLNAALSRDPRAPIPWPGEVRDDVTDATAEELRQVLRERSPVIAALDEDHDTQRIRTEVARNEGLPDFTIGLAYTDIEGRNDTSVSGNGDDALLASISINLPIWRSRYDAGVREARARREAVAHDRSDTLHRLGARLEQALFDHQDARRRIKLYETTLIPKATESLRASLSGFSQGTVDFLDLLDTERTLLEFQLQLEQADIDRATSYAEIEMLVGSPPITTAEQPHRTEDDR